MAMRMMRVVIGTSYTRGEVELEIEEHRSYLSSLTSERFEEEGNFDQQLERRFRSSRIGNLPWAH